jgi:hypothetical protein
MTLAGFPEVNRSMSEFAIYRSSTFAILLWPEQAQVTIGDSTSKWVAGEMPVSGE